MQKKEGAPTLCDSMDGTGEHYVKWNKPCSKGKYHMISSITENYEQNKQMSKIEPEAWEKGRNWQGPEGRRRKGRKEGEGSN